MNKSVSYFSLGLLVGILAASAFYALISGGRDSAGSDNRILKLAHGLDTTHPVHMGMERMKERLEELSGGRLAIDIYPSGVLGSEVQCIEQLQSGELAMTKTSTAAMESFIPELGIFGVPYLFDDESHFGEVLEGKIGRELLTIGRDTGLVGLCYYDAGSRNFYSAKKPIRTPEDLKGMKIRVQNSRMAIAMIETLGGSPTPIAFGELYSALAQGVVDGAENNPPSFESSRHYEECKFFTPDAHTRVPDLLMISSAVWDTLDERERSWLQQAADESAVYQRELWAVKTQESLANVQAAGVEIVDCDPRAFQAACAPIMATLQGSLLEPWLERIQKRN
jgi:tripartite ATP-independent transporter DctP family solute receptor